MQLAHPVNRAFLSRFLGLFTFFMHSIAISSPLVDPTQPAAGWETLTSAVQVETDRAGEQGIRLQQLIRTDNHWTAVINGQVYQPGDATTAFKVIRISHQGVIIQQGNQELRLTLESEAVAISESRSSSVKGRP